MTAAHDPGKLDRLTRTLVDQLSGYVAVLDLSGVVVELNAAARRAASAEHGRATANASIGAGVLGTPLWQLPPWNGTPAMVAAVRACCEEAAKGGQNATASRDLDDTGSNEQIPALIALSVTRVEGDAHRGPHLLAFGRTTPDPRRRSESDPAQPDPVRAPRSSPGEARPRVLVVEDNAQMNHFLTEALSQRFDVVSAMDGDAGLAQALAQPPDLILTDLMMPKLSGDRLLHEVRSQPTLDGVPVVVLTGNSDDELRLRLLREGALDFLAKPFSAKELLVRVGNLVDVKRARDVLREELASQGRDLETLARTLATKTRQLAGALETAREARQRAERANEAKDLFLSVASHELRTPLAALQLRIDRLRRSPHPVSAPEQADTFRGVQSAIDRLTMLIESLVQYANLYSKVVPVAPITFDVATMVEEVVAASRGTAQLKGLVVTYARPPGAVSLETDPTLFRTVIANLIDNAIKFTRQGLVEVTLHDHADTIRINVRDTGPGVPLTERSRIFEPFSHLEAADRKHIPGVGLGLALVREVMHALSGQVDLQSEVGTGSTFSVTLPRARQAALQASQT